MYTIYYKHKGETTEHLLYAPNDAEHCILSGKLSLGCGKAGSLVFELPPSHPEKDSLIYMSDEIIVRRDNEVLFIGRPYSKDFGLNQVVKISCEGILSYLCDSYFNPNYLASYGSNAAEFLQSVLNYSDSVLYESSLGRTAIEKDFKLGIVSPSLNNPIKEYDIEKTDKIITSLAYFTEKIIKKQGGYLRVRESNGVRYVDYLDSYGTEASQMVEIGLNVLSFAYDIQYNEVINRVCLTQKSGDLWNLLFVDADNIEGQQIITEFLDWTDENGRLPSNWQTMAKNYVNKKKYPIKSIKVNVIDLNLADETIQAFKLGDVVNVNLGDFGTEQMNLTSISYDLLNPSNDKIELGIEGVTLTGGQTNANYNYISLNNRVNKLEASETPAPAPKGSELLMGYQTATTAMQTYSTSFDMSQFEHIVVGMRFRSTSTTSTWYIKTTDIPIALLTTLGETSRDARYNVGFYNGTTSFIYANFVISVVNGTIQYSGQATGWQMPSCFVLGIY